MIVVRNEFQVKFGKMKDALLIWKELITSMREVGEWEKLVLMTDITGPAYRLVTEVEMRDLVEFGYVLFQTKNNEKTAQLYQKFVLLVESSERTIYTIEA